MKYVLSVAVFLMEVLLVLFGLTLGEDDLVGDYAILAWDLVAITYVVVGGFFARQRVLRHGTDLQLPNVWDKLGMGRIFRLCFPPLVGAIGLSAGAVAVLYSKPVQLPDGSNAETDLGKFLSCLAIILAWLILQIGYARLYAWLCRTRIPGGMRFANTPVPGFVDYLYVTITIGTSFAMSDVTVTDSRLRYYVMTQSAICFFYNTAVMAIAFRIISGG